VIKSEDDRQCAVELVDASIDPNTPRTRPPRNAIILSVMI